jgi:hypothetical protein
VNTYKIFTINGNYLVCTCKENTENGAWATLGCVKNLPTKELKKLFKIEKYVNRTSKHNRFIHDQKGDL